MLDKHAQEIARLVDKHAQDISQLADNHAQEIAQLLEKNANERAKLEDQIKSLRRKLQDLELRNILFIIEVDRLHSLILEKEKEIDLWSSRFAEAERVHDAQLQDIKRQFDQNLKNRLVIRVFSCLFTS